MMEAIVFFLSAWFCVAALMGALFLPSSFRYVICLVILFIYTAWLIYAHNSYFA